MRRAPLLALSPVLAILCLALHTAGVFAQEVTLPVPDGVLPPEVPEDNPLTPAKVDLGKKLYFDRRISTDGTVACATCHDPRAGFADGRGKSTSAGVGGALGDRNSPTVLNAAFLQEQFWDGRAPSLEAQAVQPLINPVEHGFPDHPAVVARIAEIPEYGPLFAAAFGSDQITIEQVGQAIASFERTIISLDAPIDSFLAGDPKAISEAAKRGWGLFNGKARCNTCHGYVSVLPLLTDEQYHNIGVGTQESGFEELARRALANPDALGTDLASHPAVAELGRFKVTRQPAHVGAYRTPHLRNVELTAPYMHDGSEPTLRDVIEFYDRGGDPNPWLDGGMRPLQLSDQEKADLVALLETFTSRDLERFDDLAGLMP
jgi:cytochrome c peroxidase